MLATRIFISTTTKTRRARSPCVLAVSSLLQPLAESREAVVRARNHLHAHDRAYLRRSARARIRRRLHAGDIAPEECRDVAAANFFPAGEIDVRSFERSVHRFEQGAKPLRFDHSNCLLSHRFIES